MTNAPAAEPAKMPDRTCACCNQDCHAIRYEQEQTIEQLRAELETMNDLHERECNLRKQAEQEAERLRGEVDRLEASRRAECACATNAEARVKVLEAALKKYGEHNRACRQFTGNSKCECGFAEALKEPTK